VATRKKAWREKKKDVEFCRDTCAGKTLINEKGKIQTFKSAEEQVREGAGQECALLPGERGEGTRATRKM